MIKMSVGRVAAAYAANRSPFTAGLAETQTAASPLSAANRTGAVAPSAESDFGGFLDKSISQAVETLKESERVSLAAVSGKASAQEVVRSVLAAEMTVQSVVAIRDKMVQAYQEIMRIAV